MEIITNEIIFKKCKNCNELKSIDKFRVKHLQCKVCNSIKSNANKEYYKNKYIENKEYRSQYSKELYKLKKNSLINL
jgi:hypothetical protein